jgi:alpha-mannosidase
MNRLLISILLLAALSASGQKTTTWPGQFFKGYASSIKGGGFGYHSPQPGVATSLLARSIDSVQYIEWETDPLPGLLRTPVVNLIWIFGIDATTNGHTFKLYVNENYCLSFSNPPVAELKPLIVKGRDGASLTFRTTMIDKYEDAMGYAILSLPVSMVSPGKSQVIRVVGESAGSRTWYMTFEAGVEENLSITQEEVVVKGKEHNNYSILFNFIHLGDPVKGTVEQQGGKITPFTLQPGYNRVQLLVPETSGKTTQTASVKISGREPYSVDFNTEPVRHWNIYLVQHTHTDIGYTRPQTEILPEHLRYIDYALDYCDQTDSLPDAARFRWTCETSWAVREYLKTRPASQVERLKRRVNEGRIELAGLFLNSSDLADETTIAATLQPVAMFREMGLPVNAAMQSDINGVPWCLVDYLSGAGISYLNMAQNTHRALKPFSKPTTFWWESPSGNRILVNRPEHYMWANSLGILANLETFGQNLLGHLQDVKKRGFSFDHYAIQFSGYLTDNSPPSTTACKIVEKWNQTYVWPKLQLSTISVYPAYMKKNHADEMPVVRGAWPDWWMDGFGSAAIQTAYARKAHSDYIANQGLRAVAAILGAAPNEHINRLNEQITDDISFYDEHTFGAAESITDPLCENSVVQLGEKESYVWEAVKKNHLLREEVMGLVQPFLPKTNVPTITVLNTLNWPRSGMVTLYIDHQIIPKDKKFKIIDPANREVKAQQVMMREDGTYWTLFVEEVPPMGYVTLRILNSDEMRNELKEQPFAGILENDDYRLSIDPLRGTVSGFFDKKLNKNLTEAGSKYGLGEFIYERLGKNRGQLEQLRLDEYTRTPWNGIRVSGITSGPVWKSVTITGHVPGCADSDGVKCEIRLYNHEKKVEFCYSMKKLPVTDPEGVYVAFPFSLDKGKLIYEVAGGTVQAGKEQIPGSASDWQGIQNFVAVRSDSAQIIFVSPEIPLVQLGDINLGKFDPLNDQSSAISNPSSTIPYPASNGIYSWVLNNYWTTNFLASQQGELKWNYQVTSSGDPSNLAATKFGWGNRIPMLTRIFPARGKDTILIPRSFTASNLGNLLMVSATPAPDNRSIVMQFREVNGKADSVIVEAVFSSATTLSWAVPATSVTEVNVLGEQIQLLWEKYPKALRGYKASYMRFKPYETKFVRVVLR